MKQKVFLSSLLASFLFSCSKEINIENIDSKEPVTEPTNDIITTRLENYQIPEKDIYYLKELGFSGSPIEVFENYQTSNKEKYITYLLEHDIEIPADGLVDMFPKNSLKKNSTLTQQYRTNNIAIGRTYKVIYNPNNNPLIDQAIDLAIENFNDLNLSINFVRSLTYRDREGVVGIRISERDLGGAGGRAGFPRIPGNKYLRQSGMQPYPNISIDIRTDDFGLNVLEHVITHELGHCIGLRHTDFFNRRLSCGIERDENGNIINPNEGQSSSGAQHIPGTPAMVGIDRQSIMTACFDGSENGEFTADDITALRAMW